MPELIPALWVIQASIQGGVRSNRSNQISCQSSPTTHGSGGFGVVEQYMGRRSASWSVPFNAPPT
ncbi:MAG: hypothetical protein R3A46_20975 [Thermomicrobiales bacterium]